LEKGLLAATFVTSVYDHARIPRDPRPAVAVAGRSNVGKSTLLNAITEGKNVAKVSATPGKTQALNFFLADDRFYLVDLPGYGFAKVPQKIRDSWGHLVEGYLTGDDRLRGLVLLIDCRRKIQPDDLVLLEWIVSRNLPFLIVLTKADKLSKSRLTETTRQVREEIFGDRENENLVPFSAKSKLGKNDVLRWIRKVVS
jgi:GTP-binding protein